MTPSFFCGFSFLSSRGYAMSKGGSDEQDFPSFRAKGGGAAVEKAHGTRDVRVGTLRERDPENHHPGGDSRPPLHHPTDPPADRHDVPHDLPDMLPDAEP
eukprot:CAMPEP_0185788748 /NCGR_PEP_ID=MMETSP1174-20130828/147637_1 /TAXON_ID=35687 /ORGANISM="Dictyocha speculum, Strain CCMP1381" /LENGTH=99 /DNA_ID=CAMNT_0028482565 /DNA_START=80 /DNA_END=374 /DNA_ORIENTATION=-